MGLGTTTWDGLTGDEDQAMESQEADMNALADMYYKRYIGDPDDLERTYGKAGASRIKRFYLQKMMRK